MLGWVLVILSQGTAHMKMSYLSLYNPLSSNLQQSLVFYTSINFPEKISLGYFFKAQEVGIAKGDSKVLKNNVAE